MMFDPRGIVAVDKRGDRVLFLDADTLAIVGELRDMPALPHELAISPDRAFAYVPAYGDGAHGDNPHPNHRLSVIDLARRTRLCDIDLHPLEAPHTLRFGPDGNLYVACENSAAIAVIDGRDHRLIDKIDTGSANSHRLAILDDPALICTDNEEDASISILDLAERRRIATISLATPIAGIEIVPAEARLYCSDAAAPRLLPISLASLQAEPAIPLEGHRKPCQVVRLSPDGRQLIVIGDHEPVVSLIDLESRAQRAIGVGAKPMDGGFHPDGRTFLLANEEDGTVSEIDLAAGLVRRTVRVGEGCETLAYF
ncbi:YncE family protein [Sphingomonas abietis]|uniref:Surface layer protein n=1 Tax=Sphingomonas abietis TaxID=3012344 RepID=A0ABY7NKJ0_9SPHN|nr:hypothetical protein [Sphingomonas abietis]WBO21315.1 hypothetical protein PBT88_14115 [Sphingomonas abietis]